MGYIGIMRKLLPVTFAACLAVLPVSAQDSDESLSEGMDLLQQGTRLLLEGLMSELGPALQDLQDMVVDLNAYHAPEVLPNGDIIIRRKTPLVPDPPEDGEIDL